MSWHKGSSYYGDRLTSQFALGLVIPGRTGNSLPRMEACKGSRSPVMKVTECQAGCYPVTG